MGAYTMIHLWYSNSVSGFMPVAYNLRKEDVMMNFENVRMEIVAFEAEDVITASNETETDDPTIWLPDQEL